MSCQTNDDHQAMSSQAAEPRVATRAEWTAPSLKRMRAGDAENGFTTASNDGQFTTS